MISNVTKFVSEIVIRSSFFCHAGRLSELLGQTVELAPDSIGPEVEAKIAALKVRIEQEEQCDGGMFDREFFRIFLLILRSAS